ncbi:hypothetical protein VPUCM_0780 [Vibrio parahaemolyticus UCM-V493]|nr:hypothetical protein VPUCM_0780 [Vibrio parahaemolyticus UCM-V493]
MKLWDFEVFKKNVVLYKEHCKRDQLHSLIFFQANMKLTGFA